MATSAPAAGTSSQSTLSEYAGPYVTGMLGKAQAISEQPYQVYQGPMTAGESGLQNKVFQGLGSLNFPSQLGQSFSSSGAYQPPQMNMGAYQPQPIGAGVSSPTPPMMLSDTRYRSPEEKASIDPSFDTMMSNFGSNPAFQQMLNQGSNGLGDFGNMQATTGLQNQGPAQPGGTYENYLKDIGDLSVLPQTREQFETGQKQLGQQRQQGIDMLGRGNMSEIMAGLGGQPRQMPQGGLAGLIGRMPQQAQQQPQQQTQQQPQNIAQSYMNPYLQSVLTPQLEELRRQNEITNMGTNAKLTGAGAYGGGRQAIMNAENNRNLMQEMNRTVGTGYANAYDKAMGQFNTEQGQAKTLADMMSQAGGQQRGIEQEGISADYNEFLAQRDYPQKMLQFQQSMLQGLPISTVSTSPASQTGLGSLQSTVGTLGSTYDLLKKLKVIA